MYYTYVLQSIKDKALYIGWSNNLRQRFKKHNLGLIKSTKSRGPFKLIYYEACLNKDKAVAREKYFKTGFGKNFLKNRS